MQVRNEHAGVQGVVLDEGVRNESVVVQLHQRTGKETEQGTREDIEELELLVGVGLLTGAIDRDPIVDLRAQLPK